jgi:hypothetical protein
MILDVTGVDWAELMNPSTALERAVTALSKPALPSSSSFANYLD